MELDNAKTLSDTPESLQIGSNYQLGQLPYLAHITILSCPHLGRLAVGEELYENELKLYYLKLEADGIWRTVKKNEETLWCRWGRASVVKLEALPTVP